MNFTLSGTFNGSGQFRIPVRVTMPNPSHTPTYKLVILHYKADGSYETIQPYDNGDGTISFTVTSFSPFIFAEKVDQNQSDVSSGDGQSGVSSGGGSNWVPTKEEQRRLGVMGQLAEVASYSSKYKVSMEGVMQGPKFFDAIEAQDKKYTILATYNVKLNQELLYQHEGVTRITMILPSWFRGFKEQLVMVGVDKSGTPIECVDLDNSDQTFTFEMTDAYAYALCFY